MDLVSPTPAWLPLISGDYSDHRFTLAIADDKSGLRVSFCEPARQSDPDAWVHAVVPTAKILDKLYTGFLAHQSPAGDAAPDSQ